MGDKMTTEKPGFSRRDFLKVFGVFLTGAALASCGDKNPIINAITQTPEGAGSPPTKTPESTPTNAVPDIDALSPVEGTFGGSKLSGKVEIDVEAKISQSVIDNATIAMEKASKEFGLAGMPYKTVGFTLKDGAGTIQPVVFGFVDQKEGAVPMPLPVPSEIGGEAKPGMFFYTEAKGLQLVPPGMGNPEQGNKALPMSYWYSEDGEKAYLGFAMGDKPTFPVFEVNLIDGKTTYIDPYSGIRIETADNLPEGVSKVTASLVEAKILEKAPRDVTHVEKVSQDLMLGYNQERKLISWWGKKDGVWHTAEENETLRYYESDGGLYKDVIGLTQLDVDKSNEVEAPAKNYTMSSRIENNLFGQTEETSFLHNTVIGGMRVEKMYLNAGTPYEFSMYRDFVKLVYKAHGKKHVLETEVRWALSVGGMDLVEISPDASNVLPIGYEVPIAVFSYIPPENKNENVSQLMREGAIKASRPPGVLFIISGYGDLRLSESEFIKLIEGGTSENGIDWVVLPHDLIRPVAFIK